MPSFPRLKQAVCAAVFAACAGSSRLARAQVVHFGSDPEWQVTHLRSEIRELDDCIAIARVELAQLLSARACNDDPPEVTNQLERNDPLQFYRLQLEALCDVYEQERVGYLGRRRVREE